MLECGDFFLLTDIVDLHDEQQDNWSHFFELN
jgi:hypothetical protein